MPRLVLIIAASIAAVATARAADLPAVPANGAGPPSASDVPTIGVDPQSTANFWKGFYVGSGVTASFAKGAKGAWGGDAYAGYDSAFSNGMTIGVQFDTGYSPWASPSGRFKGFDFAESEVKLGYEMGRFTPFVTAGVALNRASNFAGVPNPSASVNGVFAGPGAFQASGVAGVGVDYAVTNNLHLGVSAYAGAGGAALPH